MKRLKRLAELILKYHGFKFMYRDEEYSIDKRCIPHKNPTGTYVRREKKPEGYEGHVYNFIKYDSFIRRLPDDEK